MNAARLVRLVNLGMIAGLLMAPPLLAQDAQDAEYSDDGADSCLRCHDEDSEFPVLSIFKTRHAVQADERTPFGQGQAQCEACHGPGAAHAGRVRRGQERPHIRNFGDKSTDPALGENAVCLNCHASHTTIGWSGSVHQSEGLKCADCHTIHTWQDPVLDTVQQADQCFDCHYTERGEIWKPSTHPIRFGKMACSDCHNPHSSVNEKSLVRQTVNDTCFECHAEKRGPFLWEHAPVAEDCSLCHSPHGSNHQALLTMKPPLLCQQCHSKVGHSSTALTSQDLPGSSDGTRSAFLAGRACMNCHSQVHGSNHPSGNNLAR